MSPLSKDSASGWQPPQQGLIQGGYPLHIPLSLGERLPNWKESPINCHHAYESEVEEGQCRDIPRQGGRGRGRH